MLPPQIVGAAALARPAPGTEGEASAHVLHRPVSSRALVKPPAARGEADVREIEQVGERSAATPAGFALVLALVFWALIAGVVALVVA